MAPTASVSKGAGKTSAASHITRIYGGNRDAGNNGAPTLHATAVSLPLLVVLWSRLAGVL